LGIASTWERVELRNGCRALRFSRTRVEYQLLDTGNATVDEARVRYAREFDELVDGALASQRPDIVLTYGSSQAEIARRARARVLGSRVVFSVHNYAYRSPNAFSEVDVILTPTLSVTQHYRDLHNVHSTPVRMAIHVPDILAPVRQPAFCTFVNPTTMKGVHLFVRLLQACQEKLPDVMFLVVESRGSAHNLAKAALECGVELAKLTNFRIARNTSNPASVFAVTRVLLVPSLMEAGARIAAEAMINGIPVIGTDRGCIPETVGEGGFILPACDNFDDESSKEIVNKWVEVLTLLHQDHKIYSKVSRAAAQATNVYRDGTVNRERVALFERISEGTACVACTAINGEQF
jgi:glycosyltransferase involved in cell wall biosynthesis